MIFKNRIFICIFLLPVLIFSAASSSPHTSHDDYVASLLARMPDISADPEAYREWKIEYARAISGETSDATHTYATTAPMDWIVENGYVRADLDETTGEFDEGGDPGGGSSYVKLTFSWPESPGTEWVMYYVDGNWAKTADYSYPLPNTDSNYMVGNTAYSIWNNWNGVYIRQEITAVSLGALPGENEQIKFKAVMKPADGSCHNCGCIVFYDTMLDWNDAAEISTAFGYTGIAEIFYVPSIPPIWRAYENGYPPGAGDLVALGILIGFEAVMPDIFWYGSWPDAVGNGWDNSDWVSDTGSPFGDSATMVKWEPRNICPGDSVIFITYYGIGDISGTGLALTHTPPDITASCASVHPDPMTLTAVITNMGTSNAHNVYVTLDLSGSSLTYTGGDANPSYFSSIAGYGGTQVVNWQVDIPPSAYGTTQCYDITVTYDEGDDITEHYCVTIPDLLEEPTPTVSADDLTICEGECTFLHADPGTGGGGTCSGFSTNFDSDNGGFSGTGSWQWGNPSSGPGSAHSSPYCWATNLSGDYSNSASDALISPAIDLTGCSSATLSFWHWYSTESSWDGCQVFIGNSPSGPWTMLNMPGYDGAISYGPLSGQNCYHGSSGGWVYESVDISSYVGSTVYIRFYLASDGSVTYPGWYIDDFSITGTGGGSSTTWTWYWTPSTGLSDPSSTDPQACPSTTTTYTFTVTDGGDCIGTDEITITVLPRPVVTIPDRTICYGESVTLTASITGSYTSINWSTGESGVTYITVSPSVTTDYWVEVCNGACCDRDTATVTVSPEIILDCGPEPAEICEGGYITLSATVSGGIPSYIYTWYPASSLDNPMIANPTASPASDTWYYCTVTDAAGCDATDSVFVRVLPAPDTPVLISIYNGATEIPPGDTCLYWHSQPESVSYSVYFDGYVAASEITDTFWCTTLNCDETHTWYITATNSCGTEYSETWTFSTQTAPSGISLSYPSDGTDEVPAGDVSLGWNVPTSGSEPITYDLYVDDSLVASGLMTTSYNILVECDDTVEWFVVASNSCGDDTSETWTFFTQTSPESLELLSPDDGTTGIPAGNVTLDWTDATGSSPITYDLYIDDSLEASGLTSSNYTIYVACDDTVHWYVIATNSCGDDTSDTWLFSMEPCGFPTAVLIEPFEGAWSACDDQTIKIWVYDTLGIEESSIRFVILGDTLTTDDTHLVYVNDTLYYTPDPLWSNGDSVWFCIDSAANIHGVPITPWCSWFRIDLSPPYAWNFFPAPGSIVLDPTTPISFSIDDTLSGLDESDLTVTVNWSFGSQIFHIGDDGVSWSPPDFSIDIASLGIVFPAGDTVQVCISAQDMPDYCEPNVLDTCWNFQIIAENPTAELITPADSVILSCADQQIQVRINSGLGIAESTIVFVVNGDTIGTDDSRLDWTPDILTFTPDPLWNDGDVVVWELLFAEDIFGDTLVAPVGGTFTVDLTAPFVEAFSPPDWDTVIVADPDLFIIIADSIAGVDTSSIVLTINGTPVSYTIYDSAGTDLEYWIIEYDGIFSHNDSVEVCITAGDLVDTAYCPQNVLNFCWNFDVDLFGPVVGDITDPASGLPLEGAISSCADQGFCFALVDTEISHGVVPESIAVVVEGETLHIDGTILTYDGSQVCYHPAEDFSDGQVVNIMLISAYDYAGNPLAHTYSWSYTIDLSPPYIPAGAWPPDDSPIGTLSPVVTFDLLDDVAGVDVSSVNICISISGGVPDCFSSTDAGIAVSGDGWSADFSALGLTLVGGDNVNFCVSANDMPDFCPPNALDTCWTFYIPAGGPIGSILEPLDGTYSACDDQKIIMRLQDVEGVDESTILFSVNGTHYTTSDAELEFIGGDSLVFTPSALWTDGEVVVCSLLAADDIYGNHLTDAPIVWTFTIDLIPPVISGIVPSAGSHIIGGVSTVEFDVSDAGSGVNPSLTYCSVNSVVYPTTDGCVSWDGSHYTLDLSCAGIVPDRGDTLTICIHSGDSPDYCPPNEDDTCYTIWILDCDLAVHIDMDDTIICHPDSDLSFVINATTTGGVPPLTYTWAPAGAYVDGHIEDITATPPDGVTEYVIYVVDATGCEAYDTVYVTVSDPQISAGTDIYVCPGGVAYLNCTTIGGAIIEPYSINWYDLDGVSYGTGEEIWFEPESTVSLIVELTDAVGCAAYDTITIYYEHEAPGPFTYHSPVPDEIVPYDEMITLCWEMPSGTEPIYFDLYVDGSAVATEITDTCFDVGPFDCGETHTWFVESYNYCSPLTCDSLPCGYVILDSSLIDTAICTTWVVYGDTFAGGFDPPFHTEPCPTGSAYVVMPLDSTWSTCDDQQIIVNIVQPPGGLDIDPASIVLTVEGISYHTDGVILSWSSPALTFTPPSLWTDGQVVDVCLDSAADIAGMEIHGLPLCWQWFVDLTPPVFWNEFPTGHIYDWQAAVSVSVIDSLREVDTMSLSITLDGVFGSGGEITIPFGNPAFSFDGTTMVVHPELVDADAYGVDYSWCDDSQLVGGIYFPEGQTITVTAAASDIEPDYCEQNSATYQWTFTILDDDTLPPEIGNFYPTYASTRMSFGISVEVCDTSGVLDEEPFDAIVIYDDDGEIVMNADTVPLEIDSCWTEESTGLKCCRLVSLWNIGPYLDTTTITAVVQVYDGDYDFCNDADPTPGTAEFTIPILQGPEAIEIEPLREHTTACADQPIIIHLWDEDGIDESSITLYIDGTPYTIDDSRLTYNPETEELIFDPGTDFFVNNQVVDVMLTMVRDELGNPMWDTLSYFFWVDLEAPAISLQFPPEEAMIRDMAPTIEMKITDNLAGIDPSSIHLLVNGTFYPVDGNILEWSPVDSLEGMLYFHSNAANISFPPGDTVWLDLRTCDNPYYCDPNCSEATWWFSVEPEVGCYVHPNPFTPNGDGVNEYTVFDYPNMFSEEAELVIFSMRNIEVYRGMIGSVSNREQFDRRWWDGRDKMGNKLPPGLYIYIIVVNGEIVCDGTIVIMR
ncbi:immune inhibitor A [bacterium]|nr:immune inhibitor A [bacterium]